MKITELLADRLYLFLIDKFSVIIMDTGDLLETLSKLKKLNDSNSKNLLKLGIDMNALPNHLQFAVKEYVEARNATGLHDLNSINLETFYLNKKSEVLMLKQDILKPIQRKTKNLDKEIGKEEKKINTLAESITSFQSETISDEEFNNRVHDVGLQIMEGEKAITETPMPPIELDCDDLINKVNMLKMEKKGKGKTNMKKY